MFECAKEVGFNAFEVALEESGEINLNSTVDDMKKIKLAAESVDIEIISVASGLGRKYSLID